MPKTRALALVAHDDPELIGFLLENFQRAYSSHTHPLRPCLARLAKVIRRDARDHQVPLRILCCGGCVKRD